MYKWIKARAKENSTHQALAFFIALGVFHFFKIADWSEATTIAASAVGLLKLIQRDG